MAFSLKIMNTCLAFLGIAKGKRLGKRGKNVGFMRGI